MPENVKLKIRRGTVMADFKRAAPRPHDAFGLLKRIDRIGEARGVNMMLGDDRRRDLIAGEFSVGPDAKIIAERMLFAGGFNLRERGKAIHGQGGKSRDANRANGGQF